MACLFHCEQCGHPVTTDDVCFDGENNLCPACVEKWQQEQHDYWRPLYQGEKTGGFIK